MQLTKLPYPSDILIFVSACPHYHLQQDLRQQTPTCIANDAKRYQEMSGLEKIMSQSENTRDRFEGGVLDHYYFSNFLSLCLHF